MNGKRAREGFHCVFFFLVCFFEGQGCFFFFFLFFLAILRLVLAVF